MLLYIIKILKNMNNFENKNLKLTENQEILNFVAKSLEEKLEE